MHSLGTAKFNGELIYEQQAALQRVLNGWQNCNPRCKGSPKPSEAIILTLVVIDWLLVIAEATNQLTQVRDGAQKLYRHRNVTNGISRLPIDTMKNTGLSWCRSMYIAIGIQTTRNRNHGDAFVCQHVCLSVCRSLSLSVRLSACLLVSDVQIRVTSAEVKRGLNEVV